VLLTESLFGARGLSAMIDARRQHRAATEDLERLRAENARLREQARRLREDPDAIEAEARDRLHMMAEGEKVFIIRDAKKP
jgi:cell division protein FtsB